MTLGKGVYRVSRQQQLVYLTNGVVNDLLN